MREVLGVRVRVRGLGLGVRGCLAPISPQNFHMVFASAELVPPPLQLTEHFVIQCYISKT